MKTKDNKCDKGWHTGECCCNCKNQIELFKHPWNKVNKGSIMESTGMYACIVQFDCDKEYKGIIFEKQHGMCEMHVRKHDVVGRSEQLVCYKKCGDTQPYDDICLNCGSSINYNAN